ncbi:SAM-dependent methyltransferase [Rubricella aquisinus]|uniref:SAM-dependent methyltransferase n=1 Tax=Rubricella aquisinus TaxID=2028108 RepID=A0A840WG30_9RHOB|nr:SAM-dependent methyltransferase [Rubricella aquisinus]
MHLDVVDLKAFYYRTPLGRWVQSVLQAQLRALWPDVKGCSVEGFGFAAPYLRPFMTEAERVISLMPAEQGAMHWPTGQPNLTSLVEETEWPIPAGRIDRLLVAHGLETCERPGALMDEMWRVLAPGGRVLFIVPNRTGIWARRDATPFGYGRPYSFSQLDRHLRRHRFEPTRHVGALYAPPSYGRTMLKMAGTVEGIGARLRPQHLAGVLIVEATKQTYAPVKGIEARARSPLKVLGDLAKPSPEPSAGMRGFGPSRRDHRG